MGDLLFYITRVEYSLLKVMKNYEAYTRVQLGKLLGISVYGLEQKLKKLVDKGLIEKMIIAYLPEEERKKYQFNSKGTLYIYRITERGREVFEHMDKILDLMEVQKPT